MRTLVTIVLVLVLIPASFLLLGVIEGVITGDANGMTAVSILAALGVWALASVWVVRRRHRRAPAS